MALLLDNSDARDVMDPEHKLHWEPVTKMTNIGIVDDDVFLHAFHAADVAPAIQAISAVVFEEYQRGGLSLHLKATKTAAMVSWMAEGKLQAARDCAELVAMHGGIHFQV